MRRDDAADEAGGRHAGHLPAAIDRAGLWILMGALLLGVLWAGAYFPVPKWYFAVALLIAGMWEAAVAAVAGRTGILRSPLL